MGMAAVGNGGRSLPLGGTVVVAGVTTGGDAAVDLVTDGGGVTAGAVSGGDLTGALTVSTVPVAFEALALLSLLSGSGLSATTAGALPSGAMVSILRYTSSEAKVTAATASSVAVVATFLRSSRKSIKAGWRSTGASAGATVGVSATFAGGCEAVALLLRHGGQGSTIAGRYVGA